MAKKTDELVRYYIVNPAGCVHEVSKEHAADRLKQPGFRLANEHEVAAYLGRKTQRFDDPIAPPVDPLTEIDDADAAVDGE